MPTAGHRARLTGWEGEPIPHARYKRYGVGSTQKELLQSVKAAFPFETTVDPGGVGAVVGEKDWLW